MISITAIIHFLQLIRKGVEFIIRQCLGTGKFPTEWKKVKVVPVCKKVDKKILKNYRLVSLLLACGNVFEKLS